MAYDPINDSLLMMNVSGSPETEISPSSTQLSNQVLVMPAVSRGTDNDYVLVNTTDLVLMKNDSLNTTLLNDGLKEIRAIHINSGVKALSTGDLTNSSNEILEFQSALSVGYPSTFGVQDTLLEMGLYGSPQTEISPSSTQLSNHYIIEPAVLRGSDNDYILVNTTDLVLMKNDSSNTTLLNDGLKAIRAIHMNSGVKALSVGDLQTSDNSVSEVQTDLSFGYQSTFGIQDTLLKMNLFGSPEAEISPSSTQLQNHYIVYPSVRHTHPHDILILKDRDTGALDGANQLLLADSNQTLFNIATGRKIASGEQYWA